MNSEFDKYRKCMCPYNSGLSVSKLKDESSQTSLSSGPEVQAVGCVFSSENGTIIENDNDLGNSFWFRLRLISRSFFLDTVELISGGSLTA